MIAVLGIADHSGWAECVTVAASRGAPAIVDRRRITLIEEGLPKQPYEHDTVAMPLSEAEQLVVGVRESVMRTTFARLSELRDELQPPYSIVAMTLRRATLSSFPITVADAHASTHVKNRADGMMYLEALSLAAQRLSIPVERHARGEETQRALESLGVNLEDLDEFLRAAGKEIGPPWQKEHRLAAAAAIGVLAARTRLSLFA